MHSHEYALIWIWFCLDDEHGWGLQITCLLDFSCVSYLRYGVCLLATTPMFYLDHDMMPYEMNARVVLVDKHDRWILGFELVDKHDRCMLGLGWNVMLYA